MRRIAFLLVIFAGFGLATSAHADTITFSVSGFGNSANAILTVQQIATGEYQVLSAASAGGGTLTVTGLSTYNGADNILFLSPTFPNLVDASGIAFTLTGAATMMDVTLKSAGVYKVTTPGGSVGNGVVVTVGPLIPGQVPEPSSLMLLGTGVVGLGTTMRRRLFAR